MTRGEFEQLVYRALNRLPEPIRDCMDNVDVVVEDEPTREQLMGSGIDKEYTLLGLYEGFPLTEREGYGMVLPDKITIFQKPIESICSSKEEVVQEVRDTIIHEVAHHFGIDDQRLSELGA